MKIKNYTFKGFSSALALIFVGIGFNICRYFLTLTKQCKFHFQRFSLVYLFILGGTFISACSAQTDKTKETEVPKLERIISEASKNEPIVFSLSLIHI